MPKFVLVDNSLDRPGGHHLEFAGYVLHAAERAGFTPVIGAHVLLPDAIDLPQRWPIYRVFPDNIYQGYNLFYLRRWEESHAKGKILSFPGPLGRVSVLINDVRGRLRRRKWLQRRARKHRHFLTGCRTLFQQVRLEPGDLVMLPTVSDVELEALGEFLREEQQTAAADWHLFFHNNYLEGRPPEYEAQTFRLAAMRQSLASCLCDLPCHRLRFYATTEQLCDQFQRLGLGPRIQRLTFPVRETLRGLAPQQGPGPKRVVCAGGFREERGQCTLPQLVHEIWHDVLRPGGAQLLVQRDDPQWEVPLPEGVQGSSPPATPIVYHPHPLPTAAYCEMIRQADVGLLLHDAHSYYARLSAVLQEYLCAGIPVIVPAGCWLGDQIADDNFEHVRRTLNGRARQTLAAPGHVHWTGRDLARGQSGFAFGDRRSPLAAEIDVPAGATEVIVRWRWLAPQQPGRYARLTVELPRENSAWRRAAQVILGRRPAGDEQAAMFHLPPDALRVRLVFENAFSPEQITATPPQVTWLAAPEAGPAGLPTGYGGLSFAERSEIPRLLREMLAHYDHYRAAAREKSPHWCQRLTPDATLRELCLGREEVAPAPDLARAA